MSNIAQRVRSRCIQPVLSIEKDQNGIAWKWNNQNRRYEATLADSAIVKDDTGTKIIKTGVLENYNLTTNNSKVKIEAISGVSNKKLLWTEKALTQQEIDAFAVTATNKKDMRKKLVVWSDGKYNDTSGQQDIVTYSGEIKDEDSVVVLGISDMPEGRSIILQKKADDTDQLLSGAVFTLTKPDGTTETVSATNGSVTLSNLVPGTYTLIETTAPVNYHWKENENTATVIVPVNENDAITVSGNGVFSNNTLVIMNYRDTTSLKVTKNVTYDSATSVAPPENLETPFTISVAIGEAEKDSYSGNVGENQYQGEGTYTFTLKNTEAATITGIPTGKAYSITEADIPDNFTLLENENLIGTLNTPTEVVVTNRYFKSKKTPISGEKTWGGVTDVDALVGLEIDV